MISDRYSLTRAVQLDMHLAVAGLLHRQEEFHGERHGHEIDERGADHEQDRRGNEERQEGLALAPIEPGRHEHVDLRGDHREGDEDRAEQSELHLGEEELLRRGVDHLDRRIGAGGEPVGPQQEIVDRLGEPEADEKGDEDRAAATRSAGGGARSDARSAAPWWPRCPHGSRLATLPSACGPAVSLGPWPSKLRLWTERIWAWQRAWPSVAPCRRPRVPQSRSAPVPLPLAAP